MKRFLWFLTVLATLGAVYLRGYHTGFQQGETIGRIAGSFETLTRAWGGTRHGA